ncbi:hypothetical protein MTR67_041780 [Solanum verrucosum]|uniref:Cytochrome P450 n=1 Tax=Solanum verrucosum TaxID=315347 RepID=A0AAF0ZT25_SOLVR|nr:hypothetical protein MTR67_041780 [Solanum verrucosum]
MMFFPLFVALVIIIILTFLIPKAKRNGKCILPPGPLGLPFIGNLHQYDSLTPHLYFWKLSRKYGKIFSLKLGSSTMVVVSSANLAKEDMLVGGTDTSAVAIIWAMTALIAKPNAMKKVQSEIREMGQNFELIPFGAGRRGCPAMALGVATVELVLSNLLYAFDWELPCGMNIEDIDTDVLPGLVVHKKEPLCLVPRNYLQKLN